MGEGHSHNKKIKITTNKSDTSEGLDSTNSFANSNGVNFNEGGNMNDIIRGNTDSNT